MKRYTDYQEDKNAIGPTQEELKKIDWTRYKIIVPTKKDKEDLMSAFKHFHDSEIDTEFIPVNQLAHEYLQGSNILVSNKIFNLINS